MPPTVRSDRLPISGIRNPMASFVVIYRYLLMYPDLNFLLGYAIKVVLIMTSLFFFGGYWLFYKLEPDFAKEL